MTNASTLGPDKVYIVRIDNARFGPYQTTLQVSDEQIKALIFEVTLNAGAGDMLEHHLEDGQIESYKITNTHFQPQMSEVAAHYTVRMRKGA
ncbi:MAG: hypothetical protein PW845_28585 [Pseudomonas sp.]|uniref:hypothetical protein n=1 Tax=Pseudomonas abieticivorans TaxID=2931382 RepID=UPI0020BE98C3|nr:hypothetical protein [Pseudomonas sp. PIA16]MDE1169230.1 hypothetical protein [Pseudomonas sp.]